ncbi:MAG: redoxin domain-containing protein [Candidatus Sumerlaeota bacterium]|nr:redoxin domain-containing protein [Candidatus Sumerlaeota bacterium]
MFTKSRVQWFAVSVLLAGAALLWAAQPLFAGIEVGQEATDFKLSTPDGKSLNLSDAKGKRGVVLVFFATWCPPCMREVPAVKKFVEETKDKGVVVYGVNCAEDKAKVEKFIKDKQVNYPILLDGDGKVGDIYKVEAIPTIIGIDGAGVIRQRDHALPDDTKAFVETLTKSADLSKPWEYEAPGAVKAKVEAISKDTLKTWMNDGKDLTVVDVLMPDAYKEAHIKGAINIPYDAIKKRAKELKPESRIVVYCASFQCKASEEAARDLAALGFKDVRVYQGGIKEWRDSGLPVDKGQ